MKATCTCGCCAGIEPITPVPISNRPGLNALLYRVGIQPTFLETMLARLSSLSIPSDADPNTLTYPLQSLTTRSTDDPAIALLDAWAVVGDVFTFYQERIANEGYLRTAMHRSSILELARLVGYKLAPGVASSTYLAYTLQSGYNTLIPAGSRVQSIPAAGQLPQSFETSEDLQARAAWSNLQPRMSMPEYITQLGQYAIDINTTDGTVYLAGISPNLKPNDPVLFVFGDSDNEQVFAQVQSVVPNTAQKYTSITFPTLFTPLVFLRNLFDLVDHYLNLAAFGVSPSDQGVNEIIPLLELVQVLLELGKQYLQQIAAGNTQVMTILQQAVSALKWVGNVLLWTEYLLDLLISNGSSDDISAVIQELTSLSIGIDGISSTSIKTLLQSVESALGQFLQQIKPQEQPSRTEIDTLLQAIDTALESFLTGFTADATIAQIPNQSKAQQRSVLRILVHMSTLVPSLQHTLSMSSPIPAMSITRVGVPPNPLQDILTVWYNVYQTAAKSGAVNVANWTGALINDIKSLVLTVPGTSQCVGNIPTPAVISGLGSQVAPLTRPSHQQPASSARLPRSTKSTFARSADIAPRLLAAFQPQITSTLYTAYSNAQVTPPAPLQNLYALRVKAAPFGSSAPKRAETTESSRRDPDSYQFAFRETNL